MVHNKYFIVVHMRDLYIYKLFYFQFLQFSIFICCDAIADTIQVACI